LKKHLHMWRCCAAIKTKRRHSGIIKMKFVTTLKITLNGCAIALAGCQNMVRDIAASSIVSFGNDHIQPWFMASTDTDIMCAMGEGMVPMTCPRGPKVDPMTPMITLASGIALLFVLALDHLLRLA